MQVVSIPRKASSKDELIKLLQEYVSRVESGDVWGMIILSEGEDKFFRASCNVSSQMQIAMLSRAMYKAHEDWDKVT